MSITVVLVDDHVLFRQGVRSLIDTHFTVLAEGGTSAEAIELAERLQPDVLLLDVELPGPPAAHTVTRIRRIAARTAVVVLTMHADAALRRQLIAAGAEEYLRKTISEDALREAIRRAHAAPKRPAPHEAAERRDQIPLTDREMEVIRLVSQAYTNSEIADRLHIAEGTVKRHTSNIYDRLDATSRIDAVRKATRLGLLEQLPDRGIGDPGKL